MHASQATPPTVQGTPAGSGGNPTLNTRGSPCSVHGNQGCLDAVTGTQPERAPNHAHAALEAPCSVNLLTCYPALSLVQPLVLNGLTLQAGG